ncbi:PH domain-containing protein [Stackebrandtia endophytica]|nr:PH domain-containing protein [Stackebrandtia endophytica]
MTATVAVEEPTRTADTPPPNLRLRSPQRRVSRRAIAWWTIQGFIGAVVMVGGMTAAQLWLPAIRPWLIPLWVIVAALALVEVFVEPTWRYAVHRWETTSTAVYSASGWFVREWRVAPISRIQTVDTVAGPLQQLLGLASITVTTASAKGPVRIDGLHRETAAEMADHLTEIAQLSTGDAT